MRTELPQPPDMFLEKWEIPVFARSEPMEEFIRTCWVDGAVFPNEPFGHLQDASIGVLWANTVAKKGPNKIVAGLAEIFEPRPAKRWIMDRQTAYMHHLFGFELPDFILTFDAQYWSADLVSIATKLALVTHELCHLGQAEDQYGNPRVVRQGEKKGQPVWSIVPHDVEQFDLVVSWFGARAAGVDSMVEAAAAGPTMREVALEHFGTQIGEPAYFPCGTCGRKAA